MTPSFLSLFSTSKKINKTGNTQINIKFYIYHHFQVVGDLKGNIQDVTYIMSFRFFKYHSFLSKGNK